MQRATLYLLSLLAVDFLFVRELAGHNVFLPRFLLATRTFLPPTVSLRALNPDVLVLCLQSNGAPSQSLFTQWHCRLSFQPQYTPHLRVPCFVSPSDLLELPWASTVNSLRWPDCPSCRGATTEKPASQEEVYVYLLHKSLTSRLYCVLLANKLQPTALTQ